MTKHPRKIDKSASSGKLHRKEDRRRFTEAPIKYFKSLSPEELVEERLIAESMCHAANQANFDAA
ncbi:MAG: hypothetical protein JWN74_2846 [Acidobacteriaceae bacterium]|nr:hypothetical protein [Acidobacteriaceae bacterium]